eukprot:GHVP01052719.1.p1 GENE.GHVP01052719.1~~GHVP01052719.1.p1  ORF type:complete len:121 (-),score=7.00 GHVP01052719.1:906-1268(-)
MPKMLMFSGFAESDFLASVLRWLGSCAVRHHDCQATYRARYESRLGQEVRIVLISSILTLSESDPCFLGFSVGSSYNFLVFCKCFRLLIAQKMHSQFLGAVKKFFCLTQLLKSFQKCPCA